MANNTTTNPKLWSLDTTGSIKAASNKIFVSGLHYEPAAVNNTITLSEYAADGSTAQSRIILKAGPAAALPIDVVYDTPREFNGMYLSVITAGTLYVEIANVITQEIDQYEKT